MKIFTSYFGNIKRIIEHMPDACLMSIAGKTPDWFTGHKLAALAPHWSWWKEWHDTFKDDLESAESTAWYEHKYVTTVLDNLVPENFISEVMSLSEGHPVFLLCYETPEKFCHRHIVANWLNAAGVSCVEWKAPAKSAV